MKKLLFGSLVLLAAVSGLFTLLKGEPPREPSPEKAQRGGIEQAILAGGCFWCVESAFDGRAGVIEAVSGYTGGSTPDPNYEEVSSGQSEHVEAVRVRFDPALLSYEDLLDVFWRQIDPTDPGGQFADRGAQYRTFIFVHDERQRASAERSRAALAASGRFDGAIVTEIVAAGSFYPAEAYHQDYAIRHAEHYQQYRYASGRTPFLERIWGTQKPHASRAAPDRPDDAELRRRLTPMQYEVTQLAGTEPRFANEYWNHKGDGIYVDVVSGEPLFSSTDKFDSGTGWPSFTRPLEPERIVEKEDRGFYGPATEVRSRDADSHLGHLFDDGPPPTGLRYCINSAALRFVPKDELENQGLAKYLTLFDTD